MMMETLAKTIKRNLFDSKMNEKALQTKSKMIQLTAANEKEIENSIIKRRCSMRSYEKFRVY